MKLGTQRQIGKTEKLSGHLFVYMMVSAQPACLFTSTSRFLYPPCLSLLLQILRIFYVRILDSLWEMNGVRVELMRLGSIKSLLYKSLVLFMFLV